MINQDFSFSGSAGLSLNYANLDPLDLSNRSHESNGKLSSVSSIDLREPSGDLHLIPPPPPPRESNDGSTHNSTHNATNINNLLATLENIRSLNHLRSGTCSSFWCGTASCCLALELTCLSACLPVKLSFIFSFLGVGGLCCCISGATGVKLCRSDASACNCVDLRSSSPKPEYYQALSKLIASGRFLYPVIFFELDNSNPKEAIKSLLTINGHQIEILSKKFAIIDTHLLSDLTNIVANYLDKEMLKVN